MEKNRLVSSYSERMERAREKQELILEFLKTERYTSARVVSALLEISEPAARQTLKKMVKHDLLKRVDVSSMGKRLTTVWSLTQEGVYEAHRDEMGSDNAFLPHQTSRISGFNLEHDLDCQLVHIYYVYRSEFLRKWFSGKSLQADTLTRKHWAHIPDGLLKNFRGDGTSDLVAIEIERTRKQKARYKDIIYDHLKNVRDGRYGKVLYVLPTKEKRKSFEVFFGEIFRKNLISEEEQALFQFAGFDSLLDMLFPEGNESEPGGDVGKGDKKSEVAIKKTFSLYPSDIEALDGCFSELARSNWSDKLRVAIRALEQLDGDEVKRLYESVKS